MGRHRKERHNYASRRSAGTVEIARQPLKLWKDCVRQVEEQRGTEKSNHAGQHQIEPIAGTCHLVLSVDVLPGSYKAPASNSDDGYTECQEGKPAKSANAPPCGAICYCATGGAAYLRSNRSITKPKAMTAMLVRTQARKVRSLAALSL